MWFSTIMGVRLFCSLRLLRCSSFDGQSRISVDCHQVGVRSSPFLERVSFYLQPKHGVRLGKTMELRVLVAYLIIVIVFRLSVRFTVPA